MDVNFGIIGGSGIYQLEGLTDVSEEEIDTPFGKPSDKIVVGTFSGKKIAFLPRHGRGHRLMPTEVNFRANIFALKLLGVEKIVSISACGSLKEEIKPRDFVIPDQLYDRTKSRVPTFFGDGIVAHVGFANPYCPELSKLVYDVASEIGISAHLGGTYVCIEGPQFSTKAESRVYRELGFSIIGMTNLPEAKLAREAEICYSTVALVTDYDVWKEGEEVSVERVLENFKANIENIKRLLTSLIPKLIRERNCECKDALKGAIQTDMSVIDRKSYERLKPILRKYVRI